MHGLINRFIEEFLRGDINPFEVCGPGEQHTVGAGLDLVDEGGQAGFVLPDGVFGLDGEFPGLGC